MSGGAVKDAALTMDADAFAAWMYARVPPLMLLDCERRGVPRDAIDHEHRHAWRLIREQVATGGARECLSPDVPGAACVWPLNPAVRNRAFMLAKGTGN